MITRLLRADRQVLSNVFRAVEGRQTLIGTLIVLVCVSLVAVIVGNRILLSEEIVNVVQANPDPFLSVLIILALIAPLVLAALLAMSLVGHGLFADPGVPLLLTAPVSRVVLVVRVFIHTVVVCTLFHFAVGMPLMISMTVKTGLPWACTLIYALVSLLFIAVIASLAVLARIVQERFLAGRTVRVISQMLGGAVILSLTMMIMLGVLATGDQQAMLAAQLQRIDWLPPVLGSAADIVGAPAGLEWSWTGVGQLALLLLVSLPLLFIAAGWYDQAFQQSQFGKSGIVRVRRSRWPRSVPSSIAYKDVLMIFQERGGVITYLILACIQLVLLRSGLYSIRSSTPEFPVYWQEAFALLFCWVIVLSTIAPLNALGIVEADKKQLPLLVTSPIRPAAMLRGKLLLLVLPYAWTFVVIVVGAPFIVDASWKSLLYFGLLGIPLVMFCTGIVAAVATLPRLYRIEGPLANSVSAIFPLMATTGGVGFSAFAFVYARRATERFFSGQGPFAAFNQLLMEGMLTGVTWLIGGSMLLIGFLIGRYNLIRLLAPRI